MNLNQVNESVKYESWKANLPPPVIEKKECPICYEELVDKNVISLYCKHKFCNKCLQRLQNCAMCRAVIDKATREKAVKRDMNPDAGLRLSHDQANLSPIS